ncbi:hypothetical protein GCM10009603_01220 [Nocardiopsis exhalans]
MNGGCGRHVVDALSGRERRVAGSPGSSVIESEQGLCDRSGTGVVFPVGGSQARERAACVVGKPTARLILAIPFTTSNPVREKYDALRARTKLHKADPHYGRMLWNRVSAKGVLAVPSCFPGDSRRLLSGGASAGPQSRR